MSQQAKPVKAVSLAPFWHPYSYVGKVFGQPVTGTMYVAAVRGGMEAALRTLMAQTLMDEPAAKGATHIIWRRI